MNKSTHFFCFLAVSLSFAFVSSNAEAECAAFPQVSWWGKLTHNGVKGYVKQKHGGDWAGYLDKWRRQLANVKTIHGQGKGIKISSSGKTLKGQELGDYIGKLAQRVDINTCLSQEKNDVETSTKKKTKVLKKATTPYGKGVIAYRAGDFKDAHDIWLPVAKDGNPKAQNALGHLYRQGLGVEKNLETSRKWYTKSATRGDSVGQFSLGDIGRENATNKKETIDALRLIMKAALKNYAPAQLALAEVNQSGEGVKANNTEAYFWALLAVKNNYKRAQALFEVTAEALSEEVKKAQSVRADQWLAKHKK
jgi:TPR repeat protein